MTKNPLVTVLMSVYNGEKYLAEAIESILSQTFMDFEFLIINDGSTDASRDIILSYDDPRIALVDNDKNIGLTLSLNKGISLSKGKYIARMDADDISLPERLERQVEFMEANEDLAACGGWAYVIDGHGTLLYEARMEVDRDRILFDIFFGNQFVHGTIIFRKTILKSFLYNENIKYAQDYDLWFRLLASEKVLVNIPDFIMKYRSHIENISNALYDFQEEQAAYIVKKGLMINLNVKPEIRSIILLRKVIYSNFGQISIIDYLKIYFLINRIYWGLLKKTKGEQFRKSKFKSMYHSKIKQLNYCFIQSRNLSS
jgi:glycosyltransferase involved in cell wall biosynthesis